MIISIIIVFIVILISVLTTSKAYSYKHTIDPIDELPDTEDIQQTKKAGTDK
jgi:uncharacterized protein YpmB